MATIQYINSAGVVLTSDIGTSNFLSQPAAGVLVNGTSLNDILKDNVGGDTLSGGAGSDVYQVVDSSTKIIEAVDGGYDKVVTWTNYHLPDNVEVLDI